jgi:hypothetical protein
MQIEAYDDWDVRAAAHAVDERLPPDVRRALQHVRVWTDASCPNSADAGSADIRVRPGLRGSQAALVAVICHEAAHVALGHAQQVRAGLKSADVCEVEADALARSWGFGRELEARRVFYGR